MLFQTRFKIDLFIRHAAVLINCQPQLLAAVISIQLDFAFVYSFFFFSNYKTKQKREHKPLDKCLLRASKNNRPVPFHTVLSHWPLCIVLKQPNQQTNEHEIQFKSELLTIAHTLQAGQREVPTKVHQIITKPQLKDPAVQQYNCNQNPLVRDWQQETCKSYTSFLVKSKTRDPNVKCGDVIALLNVTTHHKCK